MDIVFLAAPKPIVKAYELDAAGALIKHPYPFIYEVTSHAHSTPSLQTLTPLVQHYAAAGSCLLKGLPGRPLVSESRAGSTDPDAKTDWACLDLDGIESFQTVDLFLDAIGAGGVSHILQWSSSMGIENKAGFRCHVFMQLSTPTHPGLLKQWLMGLNLSTPELAAQLELTKTHNSLRWPLDVTTCQNDKLIYIAPPQLGPGISDPIHSLARISYQARANQYLVLPTQIANKSSLRELTDAKVNELRAKAGIRKKRAFKYKFAGITEYLANPDHASVSEIKHERGFIYFNLNGGDSWAYYHPEDNPTFIYNFKGEPVYRTEDLLPEYWAKLQARAAKYEPDAVGKIHLAFRDFDSGNYHNGWYDTASKELVLRPAKSEKQLKDFLLLNGQPAPAIIPDWRLEFDPHTNTVLDIAGKKINTYEPGLVVASANVPTSLPPITSRIVQSALGDDPATVDHFLNWLACIIQYKDRTQTAWILHGTEGTGKGLLFHQIITPLVGEAHAISKRFEELESEFTNFMDGKLVTLIDEMESGGSIYHGKINGKLRNLIVEPIVNVRKMYRDAYPVKNYNNMIFASNSTASVQVPPDDRRFNVGGYQEKSLKITSAEVEQDLPKELPDVLAYLLAYPANREQARTPLISASRSTVIDINRTAIDQVTDALLAGDLAFFWDQLPAKKGPAPGFMNLVAEDYKKLVKHLVTAQDPKLTREEVRTLCEFTVGNMPVSPNKFTSLLKHHRIHMEYVWKDGRTVRGIEVTWRLDPTWSAGALAEIASGAV